MRTFLCAMLIALSLTPLAAAAPDTEPPVEAGPCVVSWSYFWPGETLGVDCAVGGTDVAASHGTCSVGHYAWVRVGATTVYQPCDATWF